LTLDFFSRFLPPGPPCGPAHRWCPPFLVSFPKDFRFVRWVFLRLALPNCRPLSPLVFFLATALPFPRGTPLGHGAPWQEPFFWTPVTPLGFFLSAPGTYTPVFQIDDRRNFGRFSCYLCIPPCFLWGLLCWGEAFLFAFPASEVRRFRLFILCFSVFFISFFRRGRYNWTQFSVCHVSRHPPPVSSFPHLRFLRLT